MHNSEHILVDKLKLLFPSENITVNLRKDTNFRYASTGAFMELDAWMPQWDLCFEFQDPYHYVGTWFYHHPQNQIQKQDNIKWQTVHRKGLTLIAIPCWWDGSETSLGATIGFYRPDLLIDDLDGDPIPFNPPDEYFMNKEIPQVGQLMLASFPVGYRFSENLFSHKWWIGEKYDGFRFCWNSNLKKIYTRTGNELLMHSFTPHLPSIFMDGEFWFGRGQYSFTYMVYGGAPELVHWHSLRMVVFDVPSYDFRDSPFEERYTHLLDNLSYGHPFGIIVTRIKLRNTRQLRILVKEIIEHEGEGVILRQAESLYLPGRNSALVKLKTTQGDAEAIVVQIGDDRSVLLELPDGKTFKVPPADVLIQVPKIGEIVSYYYDGHNAKDLPVSPKIFRVRHDLLWLDVVINFRREKKFLNASSNAVNFHIHLLDYWTTKRMRLYMENFAKEKNMNPLSPSTWYQLAFEAIQKFQSGRIALKKVYGSYHKIIQYLFPEIKLDKTAFPDTEKRRNFFENYAQRQGFDPLVAQNWYSYSRKKIRATEGATQVLMFHNNNIRVALLDLFPDIGLDKSQFSNTFNWHKETQRRKFFVNYAKQHGFDPYNPENWYKQSRASIMREKRALSVMSYHRRSVSRALIELFPNIGLQPNKFSRQTQIKENNTRKTLLNFARSKAFDPLVAFNWYYYSRKLVLFNKLTGLNLETKNKAFEILAENFPNIGLDASKFNSPFWADKENKRIYMIQYAKDNSFDPLLQSAWHTHLRNNKDTGISKILKHYNFNTTKAIKDIFPPT